MICFKKHQHNTSEGAERCNAKYARKSSERKLARAGYRPPQSFFRVYRPPLKRTVRGLDIYVFSEAEIPFS